MTISTPARTAGARRLRGLLPGLAFFVASVAHAQTPVSEALDLAQPAVVHVGVLFDLQTSQGRNAPDGVNAVEVERPSSGFLVSEGGLVLTNAHLVAEVREDSAEFWPTVSLPGGRRFRAEVVARDERTDLALLQLQLPGGLKLPALKLASAKGRAPGARVVALSAPRSPEHYAFAGTLGHAAGPVRLRESELEPWEVVQCDGRFHDMLDGGPLLDERGRVLGIHNSSHLAALPPDFGKEEEEDEEDAEPSKDYAVIVSADAIAAVFGSWLPALDGEDPPADSIAEGAIAAAAPGVVGLWVGKAEQQPTLADPADPQGQRISERLGSGVVIDSRGWILTFDGLLGEEEGERSIFLRLPDGSTRPARIVKRSEEHQLALLAAELAPDETLTAIPLADDSGALVGEAAAVVARPFRSALTTSSGVLSSLEREGLVQVAAWVHAGHHGGALVDLDGHLLGIAVPKPDSARRGFDESFLGFAVPLGIAREAFAEALAELGEGTSRPAGERSTPASRVAERTRQSLINVIVKREAGGDSGAFDPFGGSSGTFLPEGQGSGVIIEASGLAVSNWHVVQSALAEDGSQSSKHQIEVTLPDGRSYTARVLSTSRNDDLSLLALELGDGDTVLPVELGDSDALRLGDPVVAIGNPLGLSNSVTAGIVSNLDYDSRISGRLHTYEGMMMTDAAINPGNSGGALLDAEGRLVGINTAGSTGMGLAIPVERVREVFEEKLLSARQTRSIFLGLEVAEEEGGVIVTSVEDDGPAERGEVQAGDRILALGAREVSSAPSFARARMEAGANGPVSLRVERDGEELELSVRPLSHLAWELRAQCGLELYEVDYAEESEDLRAASIALFRTYTGREDGQPSRFMEGAVRVRRVRGVGDRAAPLLRAGDLLLGITTVERGTARTQEKLERFESLEEVHEGLAPFATSKGEMCTCWLWSEGRITSTWLYVRRVPR